MLLRNDRALPLDAGGSSRWRSSAPTATATSTAAARRTSRPTRFTSAATGHRRPRGLRGRRALRRPVRTRPRRQAWRAAPMPRSSWSPTPREGVDKPCLRPLLRRAGRHSPRRADRAGGRRQPPHDRRPRDGRAGADSLAEPGRRDPRDLVPRAAPAARPSPACCSATPSPAGRLPATFPHASGDLPTAGDRRRYPGVGGIVQLQGGRAGRLPVVRRPRDPPCLPVRLRALLHALRVGPLRLRPAATGFGPGRRSR